MEAGTAPPKDGDLLSNMRGEVFQVVGDATPYAEGQWLITLTTSVTPPETRPRQSMAERRANKQ